MVNLQTKDKDKDKDEGCYTICSLSNRLSFNSEYDGTEKYDYDKNIWKNFERYCSGYSDIFWSRPNNINKDNLRSLIEEILTSKISEIEEAIYMFNL